MDRVELMPVLPAEFQRIGLVELERIVLLRGDVHTDDLEARTMVSHRGPARSTE